MTENKLSHSGLGITAFVLSIVFVLGVIGLVVFIGYTEATNPMGIDDSEPIKFIVGASLLLSVAVGFVGLILGVISIFIKDRNNLFGILGTAFTGGFILLILSLTLFG